MDISSHPFPVLTKRVIRLMGNMFEICISGKGTALEELKIDAAVAEIRRLEKLLTTFDENSQTNTINKFAGIKPVKVDREVFELIERSVKLSQLTQGAFDITYGSIDKRLWNFDTTMTSLPDAGAARESVRLINYRNIQLVPGDMTVFLAEKGMRIGFGAIGKGYAADEAKRLLQQMNVESGIVNAAGDLTTWGNQPDGKPWTIGIADPDQQTSHFSTISISNMAVATSGNYEKYVILDGKKYSHTINPATGMPVTGIKSVSIISPAAELSDALTTPVIVMGIKAGLHLIDQLPHTGCVIVDEAGNIYYSNSINVKI